MRCGRTDERGVGFADAYDFLADRISAFESEQGDAEVVFSSEPYVPTGETVMGEAEATSEWSLSAVSSSGVGLTLNGTYSTSEYPGGRWLEIEQDMEHPSGRMS